MEIPDLVEAAPDVGPPAPAIDRAQRHQPVTAALGRGVVLGPPARAAFWETVAVPDVRKRIEDVAAALT